MTKTTAVTETLQDLAELLSLIERAADKALKIADETGLPGVHETATALIDSYENVASRITRLERGEGTTPKNIWLTEGMSPDEDNETMKWWSGKNDAPNLNLSQY